MEDRLMAGSLSSYAGGNRWITNPKQLPIHVVTSANTNIKTATTSIANAGNANFFNGLANRGAQASISVADTYVTVASLTGSGFLFNCISPTHSAVSTPTIRITVDGTVYTIAPSSTIAAGYRVLVGPLVPVLPSIAAAGTAAVAGDGMGPSAQSDGGFYIGSTGGIPLITGSVSLISPEQILSMNWASLRFESSLLVEMKCSLLSGTAVDKSCAVTYRLDL